MAPTMAHGASSAAHASTDSCADCHKTGVPLHANDDPNPVLTSIGQKPRYVFPFRFLYYAVRGEFYKSEDLHE